ncbi:ATP phosphoribosyltransferase [Haliscomenobacter hydrossis]|uniref:ATP phosphoribosyltransferase n=1 Tax=Haliscomenobacter hydrossis (strain ATCC 27775 / DSM 1100 / LMG 10767 / O) TaxID=760192 RepID=F4KVG0_HALH1|nr:ATP phosphoribosyltransferase [Haliscomenobacter hydrossis]AEE51273.1 ATP phosphoribosyltransferase [Haliscomenobacter hydrossis DSM 1100]
MPTMLKIAVQKSGRLQEDSLEMLRECGVRVDNGRDQLKVAASGFPLELFFLRNSDIPQYVADGVADVAILGQNTVIEKEKDLEEVLPLGFARCRLSLAVPKGTVYPDITWLNGKKIATSYPNTLRAFLIRHNIEAEIHEIAGSVEIAPNIGLADAICDLVSSGNTLFMNGLEEKEVILKSEAAIFASRNISTEARELLEKLIFRFKSVLAARNNKYLLMNAPNEALSEIINILPGMKSPTVVPLAEPGWSSVHTVISEDRFWEIIDRLKAAGAQGILIIPIQKMIL